MPIKNGAPVRLSDVATVFDGAENVKQAAWANDHPAVILNIQRQPGANIIAVVDRVKTIAAAVAGLAARRSASGRFSPTAPPRSARRWMTCSFRLMLTIALVVMVIFLFLRSARATVIPALAVPLSIVGTFGVMYLLGYSLNNLSLMALTISTGFVVDDAIVMIENISRFIEEGESPLQAALKGSEQIGFTILSLTVSLIAVLIPLLFMGDIVGRLFREFAITLAVTIIVSAFVSLTLTPMMSAKLLKHQAESEQGWFYRTSERGFKAVIDFYGRTLQFVLRYRKTTLLVTVATLVGTILLYIYVPKGFFPVQDTGIILGVSEAPQNISFSAMAQRQQDLASVILKDPAVESLSSFIGIDGTNATINSGRIQINLKPLKQRGISASDVIRRLQPQIEKVDGITLFMQPVQDLTVEDRVSRTEFQYSLEDVDPKELAYWTPNFIDKLKSLPELRDVASDQLNQGLLATLTIDRDTASRLGILPGHHRQHALRRIRPAPGLHDVHAAQSVSRDSGSESAIPAESRRAEEYLRAFLHRPAGSVERLHALRARHHSAGRESPGTISGGDALVQPCARCIARRRRQRHQQGQATTSACPPAFRPTFQGTAAAFLNSLANEPILILAAIITVYIVLGVLYESYIHPITIISTLPSAGVGAILALLLCHTEFSVIALIGIILLIGIVKKNAIMMIDFALEAERKEGKAPLDAIYEACLLRFRPIMMTTMAALLGGLPLALGSGVGSELRRPLGITIVGGLILSQLLTLYTTPVVYLAFDALARRFRTFHIGNPVEAAGAIGLSRALFFQLLRAIYPPAGGHVAARPSPFFFPARSRSDFCPWRRCRKWIFRPFPSAPVCPEPARKPWPPPWPRRWSASSAASPASRR